MNTYKNFLNECRESIFITQRTLSPLAKTAAFTAEMDKLLANAYSANIEKTELDKHICLIALGGYGRGELCPYSDIDLLILHSGSADKNKISAAVRFFWDMGLNLGLVVRSLHECYKILGEDIASDTALLQTRFLAGNKRLFHHAEQSVFRPYFTKHKKQLVNILRSTVHDGIFSADNTLYRTEPNVKDGICALRDCQRILWAERVISGARTIADLYHLAHYRHADIDSLAAAYEFLIGLRCELHMLCRKRMDTLESALQPDIAASLGFGRNNPDLLLEAYYRTVRSVKYFAVTFLEKRIPARGFWVSLRTIVGAMKVKNGILLLDGILFIGPNGLPADAKSPSWILDIFKLSAVYSATISVEIINWIRSTMQDFSPDDFKSEAVDALFLDIMSQDKDCGRTLMLMHDCGFLSGVIPAFAALTCKVEYDDVHEFTVDQHILLALSALDELDNDPDNSIRTIYARLSAKRLLRLAVLLHDIGKGMKGDHAVNGSIIAEEMCDRLGLLASEKRLVVFLVYNHLEMSTLAFGRELEDSVVSNFAKTIENRETLDMLYLLTILDIRHVGFKTWTAWRAQLLENAYERIAFFLLQKNAAISDLATDIGIDSELYRIDTLPEEQNKHRELLTNLKENDFVIELESFVGFDRLTVLSFDRMGFFADITGCISSEGYGILSARVYSTHDGRILDIFNVEPDGVTHIPSKDRIENIKRKWTKIVSGTATTQQLLDERTRMYPQKKFRTLQKQPSVRIDNDISKTFTVLDIEAQDSFGLLYRMTRILSNHGVNIVSARLSTRIDRAADMFYVTDAHNLKITDEHIIAAIAEDLTKAVSAE